MTSIDRTIYRLVNRNYMTKALIEAYTPTEEERRFVDTMDVSELRTQKAIKRVGHF